MPIKKRKNMIGVADIASAGTSAVIPMDEYTAAIVYFTTTGLNVCYVQSNIESTNFQGTQMIASSAGNYAFRIDPCPKNFTINNNVGAGTITNVAVEGVRIIK